MKNLAKQTAHLISRNILSTAAVLTLMGAAAFAAAPVGGYQPGDTLNPDCSPTDVDCKVVFTQAPNKFIDGTTATDAVFTGGNVGIGTDSPYLDSKLHIYHDTRVSDIDPIMTISATSTNGNTTIGKYGIEDSSNNLVSKVVLKSKFGQPVSLGTRYEDNLTIIDGGNVGIGTTTPLSKLEVHDGEIHTSKSRITANPVSGACAAGYTHNDENGNATIDDFECEKVATNNSKVTIGYKANEKGGGQIITAVGEYAAQNNTAFVISANGSYAAQNNIGNNLTANGYSSARFNTGYYVTTSGQGSAQNNKGTGLTANGYYTADNNTGNSVTANGVYAARNNTGNNVTANGYGSAQNNTGNTVTANGVSSALENTGGNITVSGYSVARYNTGGNLVANGYATAEKNTGDNVTANGMYAGQNNVGNNLVASGFSTAQHNTGNTVTALGGYSARNNSSTALVAVGYNAGRYSALDNNTAVGTDAYSKWTDGTTNYSISSADATADTVTVTGHGIATGKGKALKVLGAGIGGLGNNAILTFLAIDANTLKPLGTNITSDGTATLIDNANTFTNVTALGYSAQPSADNQIQLGNDSVNRLKVGTTELGMVNGNVGIGTLNPDAKIHIGNTSGAVLENGVLIRNSQSTSTIADLATGNSNEDGAYMGTYEGDDATMYIQRSMQANLYLSKKTGANTFSGSGNGLINGDYLRFSADGTARGSIAFNGSMIVYNTNSDERLKENITDIDGALNRVSKIKVKNYNFIGQDKEVRVDGFIAQQLKPIVPYAVTGEEIPLIDDDENKDGLPDNPMAVDYSQVVPLLTAAIQELKKQNDSLQIRIEQLESK